jgi:D-aspartate ligase
MTTRRESATGTPSAPKAALLPAIVVGTHTMGLGVIRALGEMQVPVVAVYYRPDDMGYVSRYVRESVRVPHPETSEEAFLDCLMGLRSRFAGSPVFPVSDEALKIVSRHKPLLAQHFRVACPDWETIRLLIEKNLTYKLAAAAGVPIPRTLTPASMDEVAAFARDLQYPCLVKPEESHRYFAVFKKKIVKAHNADQLTAACREAEQAGLRVMLQEFIPGDDAQGVNYNSYCWEGRPVVQFTAQKVRSSPPEVGSPCVAVSREIPAVFESGAKLLRAMGFYGYSCTEFKRDPRDGVYKLLEVNGRHNLSTLLAVRCGINFPWLHYRHLVEGTVPGQSPYREGVFWIDLERDVPFIPRRLFKYRESLAQIASPYFKPHVFAVYDAQDRKPFFKRYENFGKQAIRRWSGRAATV